MMNDDIPYIPGYHRRSSGGRVILYAMLTSALVSAATTVAVLRWGPPLLKRGFLPPAAEVDGTGAQVQVPQVVSLGMADADQLLTQVGLRMMVATRKESDILADTVIEQMPLQGTVVNAGQTVSVVLSSGRSIVATPELAGHTLEEATAALSALGMAVGEVTEVGEGEAGKVVGQVPPAGSQLAAGATINLQVGVAKVVVPELLGIPIDAARKVLEEQGLGVGPVSERYDRRRRGYIVLEQDPAANAEVPRGTAVTLVINEGD